VRPQEHSLKRAIESLPSVTPLIPDAASFQLGWVELQAARYRNSITNEFGTPPICQHSLILVTRPPEKLNLRYEGVNQDKPPAAGSVALMPAGSASLWHWRGSKDSLHIYLEPSLIARVATTSFELDSARMLVPSLDSLIVPELREAMLAVDAELAAGGSGGPLMIESLANVLAVHLIRHFLGPRRLIVISSEKVSSYIMKIFMQTSECLRPSLSYRPLWDLWRRSICSWPMKSASSRC
jgi:AraC family transcriptional regulator